MRTFVIGRSRRADIQLSDPSVSRIHAELVVIEGKQMMTLTDKGSTGGLWLYAQERWQRIAQESVIEQDWIRFGKFETSVATLLSMVTQHSPSSPIPNPSRSGEAPTSQAILRGGNRGNPTQKVKRFRKPVRDPATGEIIEQKN